MLPSLWSYSMLGFVVHTVRSYLMQPETQHTLKLKRCMFVYLLETFVAEDHAQLTQSASEDSRAFQRRWHRVTVRDMFHMRCASEHKQSCTNQLSRVAWSFPQLFSPGVWGLGVVGGEESKATTECPEASGAQLPPGTTH